MTQIVSRHGQMRQAHEELFLQLLRRYGALSRADLAQRAGLSRTTTSEITSQLLESRAIVALPPQAMAGRGRPAELLSLDPSAGQLVGLDFSHRHVRVVVANSAQETILNCTTDYPQSSTWTERAQLAIDLMESIGTESKVHYDSLSAIGIGFPGPFSERGYRLALGRDQQDTSALEGSQKLLEAFRDRYSAPITIDNNARLAGLGEAIWGSEGEHPTHLMYLRLGQGIGGALIVDGTLTKGAWGYAGEYGHITVQNIGTRQCRCGKRGCLETIASIPAVLSSCEERGLPLKDLDDLATAWSYKDPIVASVFQEVGRAVGQVMGSQALAVDPHEIVIGGQLISIAPEILEYARTAIEYELLPIPEANPLIRAARLADDAGARGAIAAISRRSTLLERYEP